MRLTIIKLLIRKSQEDDLNNVEAVNYVAELRRQISSRDACYLKAKDTFETYFRVIPPPQTKASGSRTGPAAPRPKSNASKLDIPSRLSEEFETFASIRTFSRAAFADSKLTVTKRNSDDLSASFTTRFVRPPCETFLRSDLDDKGNPTGQYWV